MSNERKTIYLQRDFKITVRFNKISLFFYQSHAPGLIHRFCTVELRRIIYFRHSCLVHSAIMGGCTSKPRNQLSHLDDSVKVMVRHDANALAKKGERPGGFVPRAEHPIIEQMHQQKEKHVDGADVQPKSQPVVIEELDLETLGVSDGPDNVE